MTISQSESGLSAGDYTDMQTPGAPEALRVTAYNPIPLQEDPALAEIVLDFGTGGPQDIVKVLKAWNGTYYVITRTNGAYSGTSTMSLYDANVKDGAVDASGNIYLFTMSPNIKRTTISPSGTVNTTSAITGAVSFAAASNNLIFYFKDTSSKNNYQLFALYCDSLGVWTDFGGLDIYLPGYVQSIEETTKFPMSAIGFGPLDPFKGLIAFKAVLPGPAKIATNGTTVTRYTSREAVIMTVLYDAGIVHQPAIVDSIIDANEYNRTRYVNLQKIGDHFVITTERVILPPDDFGLATGYVALSMSRDGLHWSALELTEHRTRPTFHPATYNAAVPVINGRPYLIRPIRGATTGLDDTSLRPLVKSPSLYSFADCDAGVDITDYVEKWDASFNNMLQVGIEVSPNAPVSVGQILRHEAGRILPGDTLPTYTQIGVTEIDKISTRTVVGDKTVLISSRDAISQMTDKVVSKDGVEFDGYFAGFDDYNNTIDAKYGGLAHTAIQSGTWDNTLAATLRMSSAGDGYVHTTYGLNQWNGRAIVYYQPTLTASGYLGARVNNGIAQSSFVGVYVGNQLVINHGHNNIFETVTTGVTAATARWIVGEWKYGKVTAWTTHDGGTTWFTLSLVITYTYCAATWKELEDCLEANAPAGPGAWALYASNPGGETSRYQSYRFTTYHQPLTVGRAVRLAGAYAGVSNYNSRNILSVASSTPSASGFGTSIKTSLNAAYSEFPHSFEVNISLSSTGGHVLYRPNKNVIISAGLDTFSLPVIRYSNLTLGGWTTLYYGTLAGISGPVSNTVRIVFRSMISGTSDVSNWYTAAIYRNSQLLAVAGERITVMGFQPEGGRTSDLRLLANTAGNVLTNISVSELSDTIDTMTIDPGETPMQGLMRAIESRHLNVFLRANNQITAGRISRNLHGSHTLDMDTVSSIEETQDIYPLKNSYRIIGSTFEAHSYEPSTIHRERFSVYSTGAVTDPVECKREAIREALYNKATAITRSLDCLWIPFLEYLDTLDIDGTPHCVTGWALSFSKGGNFTQQINAIDLTDVVEI